MFVQDFYLLFLGLGLLWQAFILWFALVLGWVFIKSILRAWATRHEAHTWDVDIFNCDQGLDDPRGDK